METRSGKLSARSCCAVAKMHYYTTCEAYKRSGVQLDIADIYGDDDE